MASQETRIRDSTLHKPQAKPNSLFMLNRTSAVAYAVAAHSLM
jgi:hypothetical protein